MPKFIDDTGRLWRLELSASKLVLIKEEEGALDVALVDRMADDPGLLGRVLWLILMDQAEQRGIKGEDFGRELGTDGIARAYRMLKTEVVKRGRSVRSRK